jgi:E3 ubiquitin-protein ligase RAD18
MEDLVEAFKKARPEIWLFATKPVEVLRAPSPLPSLKRSLDFEAVTEEGLRKLRRRSSGRNRPQERTVVVDSAEDDDDYVPGKTSSFREFSI